MKKDKTAAKPSRDRVKVNRADFLAALESCKPGLSPKGIIEQSNCYVFTKGRVVTYNENVSCRCPSGLPKEFTGAVLATPLLSVLHKLKTEDVYVKKHGETMVVSGGRDKARIRFQAEVKLPYTNVDQPTTWDELPEDFTQAVSIVQACAGKDTEKLFLTCVNLHPKRIEACDDYQLTRYRIKTGLKKAFMVKRDSIKHVIPFDMTEISESLTWVHFRNPSGLVISCQRFVEEFPDLSEWITNAKGVPTPLPKGLSEAGEFCQIFTKDNEEEDDQVLINLSAGELRMTGVGDAGEAESSRKIRYKGKSMAFMISPTLLTEITKRHTECEISKDFIKVDGGKWVYVACLGSPEDVKAEAEEKAHKADDEDLGDDE